MDQLDSNFVTFEEELDSDALSDVNSFHNAQEAPDEILHDVAQDEHDPQENVDEYELSDEDDEDSDEDLGMRYYYTQLKTPEVSNTILYPLQLPTSVSCSFFDVVTPDMKKHLIIGKPRQIEIYRLTSNGLELSYTLPLRGHLRSMAPVSIRPEKYKAIAYTVDDGTLNIAQFNHSDFENIYMQNIAAPYSFDAETLIAVDEKNHRIAVHFKSGSVQIFLIDPQYATNSYALPLTPKHDLGIHDGSVSSIHFLNDHSSRSEGLLGVTYAMPTGPKLLVYSFKLGLDNFVNEVSLLPGSPDRRLIDSLLIPLPTGFLAMNMKQIFHVSFESATGNEETTANKPASFNLVWKRLDYPPLVALDHFANYVVISDTKFLVSCIDGSVYLSALSLDNQGAVKDIKFEIMGYVPSTTSLVHLSGTHFFASSHHGPSVLFELQLSKMKLKIIQELDNLGPILDIVPSLSLAATDSDYGYEYFLCSGGFKSGTIKKFTPIRTFETVAKTQIAAGLTRLWFDAQFSAVVTSSAAHTVITPFEQHTSADAPSLRLQTAEPTLAFYSDSSHHIQVTHTGIYLFAGNESKSSIACHVVSASISRNTIAVYLDSNVVETYSHDLVKQYEKHFDHPISAIDCGGQFLAVSTWHEDCWLTLIDMSTDQEVSRFTVPSAFARRPPIVSLKLLQMKGSVVLLVSCTDGSLCALMHGTAGSFTQILIGGSRPSFFLHDKDHVLALSDKPCKIMLPFYSNASSEICFQQDPFLSGGDVFAGCIKPSQDGLRDKKYLFLTTDDSLLITDAKSRPQTALWQVFRNRSVRRIALSSDHKYLAVGEVRDIDERAASYAFTSILSLYDASTLTLSHSDCLVFEEYKNAIIESVVNITKDNQFGSTEFFCVGITYSKSQGKSAGAIFLFRVDKGDSVQDCVLETDDPIKDMVWTSNKLVVSHYNKVSVYELVDFKEIRPVPIQKPVNASSVCVSLSFHDNNIFIGDLMSGATRVDLGDNGLTRTGVTSQVMTLDRSTGAFVTAVDHASCDDFLIIGDSKGDIYGHYTENTSSTRHGTNSSRDFMVRLGEPINCIKKLPTPKGYDLYGRPLAVIGTASGGLYALTKIRDKRAARRVQDLCMSVRRIYPAINSDSSKFTNYPSKDQNSDNVLDCTPLAYFFKMPVQEQKTLLSALHPLTIDDLRSIFPFSMFN